jgi:diguanylate cyclase (GGDEF)-like protein
MLPKFKRVERINNATQPLVVTYTQQLRWIDFVDTGSITIYFLLLCGLFFVPWLTIRHYKAISEAHIAHEKSAYLATHDVLTDLPNRFLFNDRLNQAALNWQRNGSHFAIMLIDLDHFKEVNDNFGHEIGDQVLCEAAKRMPLELRSFDTVARYGGDEFIVLLTNVVDAEDTQLIGEKICAAISLPITTKAGNLTISCSIGIAVCPTHGEDLDTLRQLADVAMYKAKQSGRNAVAFAHSPSPAKQT